MDYCKQKGIQRQLTVRYSPQQNGVAERKIRTIVEMARSMMAGKGLPKSFWAEAMNTSVYILNRSPTKAVLNKTPYEVWYQRKPQQRREKFDEKGEKVIHVGYSDESKGYRLFDTRKQNSQFLEIEPQNFDEAAKEEVWKKAMDEEIACIEKNHRWDLVHLPDGKNVIGVKWIYKTKYKEDGSIHKHKARLVVKGYSQQPGIDFIETFAPLARMETIRIVLVISAQLGLPVY
ncbi:UNVERIFIED_CONTAM: Copia protein [Sesamum radiatum]|uniref:Copia protein n=1 Tax=Sesamum radiatum TaxID=300843 RepID=A0AAW2KAU5_SESRA